MKAIKGGYKEIAQFLLDVGININLSNYFGDTPLHWAVSICHCDIYQWKKFIWISLLKGIRSHLWHVK